MRNTRSPRFPTTHSPRQPKATIERASLCFERGKNKKRPGEASASLPRSTYAHHQHQGQRNPPHQRTSSSCLAGSLVKKSNSGKIGKARSDRHDDSMWKPGGAQQGKRFTFPAFSFCSFASLHPGVSAFMFRDPYSSAPFLISLRP